MPAIYPFTPIQYSGGAGDISRYLAPPYDVLDAEDRAALIAKDPRNVVAIDLPHVPPKQLGPPEAYETAAASLNQWLEEATLARAPQPSIYAYRQTFQFRGETYQRCGMACTVEVVPFGAREGGGILPHEETFSGPKEDRFALMKATSAQLSPIFGLHADEEGHATAIVHKIMALRAPDMRGDLGDGVLHEVWTINDDATINAYRDALAGEDVFIADGHHRYTTGLNYLAHLESENAIPLEHPARRCMMVLVGMSDPGLAIGPTHRVLGSMADYSLEAFLDAIGEHFEIVPFEPGPSEIERAIENAPDQSHALGLIDFASGKTFIASLRTPDPLAAAFPEKPQAWRTLDVSLIQHIVVDQIAKPKLNRGEPVTWAFPHSVEEALEIGSGAETGAGGGAGFAQIAVIVRPTPLDAVRDISKANELMPQKSTFFYPKLATGLFINPLA